MDNRIVEPFPILNKIEFDKKITENRRYKEKITFIHMINIYCKNEKHENRFDIKLDDEIFNGKINKYKKMKLFLCEECLDILKYSLKRTDKCVHMDYKTFCNRCPTPCYNKEYRKKVKNVMVKTRKSILIKHPIITMKHFKSTMIGIKLSKKYRGEENV